MRKNQNPLSYLLRKTWQYSDGNKSKIVLYWAMFITANIIDLVSGPIVWAKIIDVITKQGITKENIGLLLTLLSLTLLTDVLFWSFHGPARLIERINAFKARANYRKHLLKGVMSLPMGWHVDHHSGDTIDRIEKGASGLYSFSENSFLVISAIVQFLVSYAMLIYFSPVVILYCTWNDTDQYLDNYEV
jgi:ATP-binding cassette subfamily B protein